MEILRSLAAIAASAAIFFAPLSAFAQTLPMKVWTVQSPMVPLGCFQLTAVSAATSLQTVAGGTIPTLGGTGGLPATLAVVQVENNAARWTDDGVHAPTTTFGMPLSALTPIYFSENPLSNAQLIPQTGTMTIDACFYGVK